MRDRPVFLPLAVGIESDIVEKLVQPGSVIERENLVAPFRGEMSVRLGSDTLSTDTQATIPAGGALPDVWQLGTLGGQLVRLNQAPVPIHMWAPDQESWMRPGDGGLVSWRAAPTATRRTPVFAQTAVGANVGSPDEAVSVEHGLLITVHEVNDHAAIVFKDLGTRRVMRSLDIIDIPPGIPVRPRVCVVGDLACVAYVSSGVGSNVQLRTFNLNTLAQVAQTYIDDCTNAQIDICTGSVYNADGLTILYREDAAGELWMAIVPDPTVPGTFELVEVQDSTAADPVPNLAFCKLDDDAGVGAFSVIVAGTTGGLRVLWDIPAPTAGISAANATHVLDGAATAAPAGGTAGIRNVTGTTTTVGGNYVVLYEVTAPDHPTRGAVNHAYWTGVAGPGAWFRSFGLRSKLFRVGEDHFGFWAAFAGTDQRTCYAFTIPRAASIYAIDYAPIAIQAVRDAGGLSERVGDLSSAPVVEGVAYAAVTTESRTESIATALTAIGATSRLLAIDLLSLSAPANGEMSKPVEFIGSMFVPGGALGFFDGLTYGIPGFAYYPPQPTLGFIFGGNLEASALYGYRVVYAFLDANGRKWRSAPCAVKTISTTGVDLQIDVVVQPLRIIDRGPGAALGDYQIEVYRTQGDAPGAHFLVATIANTVASTTITLRDNVADADLGEQLYTDGDGLENQLLPAISHVVRFQNRLMCAEAGSGTLWYSLEADLTHGLLFNEALTVDVGDPGEPITGLAVIGQALGVLKKDKFYALTGSGADALGRGATYSAELRDAGVGCTNAASIVETGGDAWFDSTSGRAGMHRLTGALTAEYVGQGVRKYADLEITGSVCLPHASQLRFYTDEARTLVFDLATKLWSTNTEQPCVSAVTGVSGVTGVVYARSVDGYVLSEATLDSDEPFMEAGTAYAGIVRSPWYAGAGPMGWERVRRALGIGKAGDPHRVTARLYRDYDDTDMVGEVTKAFDGTSTKWEWFIRPRVETLAALMFEIEIGPAPGPVYTAGPGITGITLLVATKRGAKKQSPANRLTNT